MKRDKIELTNKLLEVVEMIEVLNFTIEDNVDEEGRVEMNILINILRDYQSMLINELQKQNMEILVRELKRKNNKKI